MRRPDPAKQCLWLGPGKYRGCGRDTASDPNCFADSYIERYSMRGNNANTYSHRECDPYCNTDDNAFGYANCNTYSKWNRHPYTKCNAYSERNSYAQGDAKASANSAPPADTVVPRLRDEGG